MANRETSETHSETMRIALIEIAATADKTLLGGRDVEDPRRAHEDGAHAAFAQCARIAQQALDQCKDAKVEGIMANRRTEETHSEAVRHRINVTQTTTGKVGWECTVEFDGGTLALVLAESDALVAALQSRYPAPEGKEAKA